MSDFPEVWSAGGRLCANRGARPTLSFPSSRFHSDECAVFRLGVDTSTLVAHRQHNSEALKKGADVYPRCFRIVNIST